MNKRPEQTEQTRKDIMEAFLAVSLEVSWHGSRKYQQSDEKSCL